MRASRPRPPPPPAGRAAAPHPGGAPKSLTTLACIAQVVILRNSSLSTALSSSFSACQGSACRNMQAKQRPGTLANNTTFLLQGGHLAASAAHRMRMRRELPARGARALRGALIDRHRVQRVQRAKPGQHAAAVPAGRPPARRGPQPPCYPYSSSDTWKSALASSFARGLGLRPLISKLVMAIGGSAYRRAVTCALNQHHSGSVGQRFVTASLRSAIKTSVPGARRGRRARA